MKQLVLCMFPFIFSLNWLDSCLICFSLVTTLIVIFYLLREQEENTQKQKGNHVICLSASSMRINHRRLLTSQQARANQTISKHTKLHLKSLFWQDSFAGSWKQQPSQYCNYISLTAALDVECACAALENENKHFNQTWNTAQLSKT